MLHLHPPTGARQVRLVVTLRHDPVLAEPGLVGEPALRDAEIVGPRCEQKIRAEVEVLQTLRRLRDMETLGERREPIAPLGERLRPELVSVLLQQVEQDQAGGDLRGEFADARLGRVEPELQLVEREPPGAHHDDLPVRDERSFASLLEQRDELREEAHHRPVRAAVEPDLVTNRDDRAEPVPLRLVGPTRTTRDLGLELGEHRTVPDLGHAGTLSAAGGSRRRSLQPPSRIPA